MKTPFKLARIACAISFITASTAAVASANDFRFPYNRASPVQFNEADLQASYEAWKAARITSNNAGAGRYRVMGGVTDSTTVSEGIAYGMILTLLFDDQAEFDGLWLFAKDHFDNQDLMHWHIGSPGQLLGQGAATDGDVDMAIALVYACVKVQQGAWSASGAGLDYCSDAYDIIENIYRYEIDQPGSEPFGGTNNNFGDELMPGDQWDLQSNYPNGVVNLSYFSPGFFRVFGKFTGQEQKWQDVIDRNYLLVDEVQGKPDNCSNLVPNWNQYDGEIQVVPWQPNNSGWWSWDAARFGWRIATDAMWYGAPDAMETVNELGSFFASVGINRLGGEYQMDGQSTSGANDFFTSNAAAAIVAASQLTPSSCGDATGAIQTTPQQAYDRTRGSGYTPTDYYAAYWRLINMMLMTGNFPNLYELASDTGGDSAPVVTLTIPGDGDTFDSGAAISIQAYASDDGQVTQVEFFVDGDSLGVDTSAPYSISVSTLSDGSHSIYAEATDDEAQQRSSGVVFISIRSANATPTASFTTSTSRLAVSVNGSGSSDTDGSIQSYQWRFGDGTSASGVSTSHGYGASGDYLVELTVTDNDGASNTSTKTVTVIDPDLGGSCACEYVVANSWNSGFVAEIRITNNGTSAINGWNVSWSYAGDNRMSSGWNAIYSGNNPYSATPYSWNSVIQPGQTIAIGFQGSSSSGNAEAPEVTGVVFN